MSNENKFIKNKDILKELLKGHETIIVHLRKSVEECSNKNKDIGTADFLTGSMQEHETMA